jgi:hypothetical protein
MGNKINRGALMYFLIFLGMIVAAFIICVVIMVCVPGFNIFGLSYFNEYESDRIITMEVYSSQEGEQVNVEGQPLKLNLSSAQGPIENIVVDSKIQSVKIYKTNSNQGANYSQFAIDYVTETSGFTTNKGSDPFISVKYYQDKKTLHIVADGPSGFWVTNNNSSITIQIPPSYNTSLINLTVNSNNQTIKIGDSFFEPTNMGPTMLALKTVNLNTTGAVTITNYTSIGESSRGDCSISIGRADFNIPIKADNLTFKVGGGSINFIHPFYVTNKFEFESDGTIVAFSDIYAATLNLKNVYGKLNFKDIFGDVNILTTSSKCEYIFTNISGKLNVGDYAQDTMIDGGSLTVNGNVSGETFIAIKGDVNFSKVTAKTSIKNTSGRIVIPEVLAEVSINTQNGEVTLGEVNSEDGEFVRCGIDAKVEIVTENGRVNAYFNSVHGEAESKSTISTKNGEIKVYLKQGIAYDLTAVTTRNLKYLGNKIEEKTGHWAVGSSPKYLELNSEKADINIESRA